MSTRRAVQSWPAALAVLALVLCGCRAGSEGESALRLRWSTPASVVPGGAVYAVATAKVLSLSVFEDRGGLWPSRFLDNPQPDGSALVLLVEEQQPGWFKALLPVRPNGSTGWIREADVTVATHDYRIEVEVGARRMTVWKGSEVFLRDTVGVGAPSTPTTLGRFYTTALFDTSRTQPDFGPYAYPLSGYSEVLYDYLGGEGQMGIHGTDDPSSLGRNVSHGCVRMSNDAITRLAKALPVGVPVEIRA